jgi:hypothetical protein
VGLWLPLVFVALSTACGGDSDDEVDVDEMTMSAERMGPAGCYIEAEFRCDCALDEAACTEDVGIWVDMGCGTCAT